MSDEFIIQRKLLLDGEGSGEDHRLNNFLKQFSIWIKSRKSPTECETGFNNLSAQLNRLKLNKKRIDLRKRCTDRQLEKYRSMQEDYQVKKEVFTKNIEKQQNLLEEAKIVKKFRIERDLIVKIVNEGQSCKQLKKEVDNLKKDILNFEEEKSKLQIKLNNRVRQFRLLAINANILQVNLKNDY